MANMNISKNQMKTEKIKSRLVFFSLIILPLTQFFLFYICVNTNSILLAFKKYNTDGSFVWTLENFKNFFYNWSETNTYPIMLKNSIIAFLFNFFVGISLALIFSYYIFKKMLFSDVFKVMLFLPSIVSEMVMVVIFMQFTEEALPNIINKLFNGEMIGLISDESTRFGTHIFYSLWVGFGTQILMYVGAMNGINEAVLEAGKIDGVNAFSEFIHIVLPGVYETMVVFATVSIVGVFTNKLALFSFYGAKAEPKYRTIGYFLYAEVQKSKMTQYPYYSALGIICTIIVLPITLIVRKLLQIIGPSED